MASGQGSEYAVVITTRQARLFPFKKVTYEFAQMNLADVKQIANAVVWKVNERREVASLFA